MKICLVGSSGGHLTHLKMLKPFWEKSSAVIDAALDMKVYSKKKRTGLIQILEDINAIIIELFHSLRRKVLRHV